MWKNELIECELVFLREYARRFHYKPPCSSVEPRTLFSSMGWHDEVTFSKKTDCFQLTFKDFLGSLKFIDLLERFQFTQYEDVCQYAANVSSVISNNKQEDSFITVQSILRILGF